MKAVIGPSVPLQQGAMRKPYKRDCFWNSSWQILAIEPNFPIQKRNYRISFLRASVSVGVCFQRGISEHRASLRYFLATDTWITYLSLQFAERPWRSVVPKVRDVRFAKCNEITYQLLCQRLWGEKIWLWVSAVGEWLAQVMSRGCTCWLLANSGSASDWFLLIAGYLL